MATIKLDPAAVTEAKAFYQEELQKALSRLNHIQHMLAELGDSSMSIEIIAPGVSTAAKKSTRKAASTSTKKRKAKPGPKSKWDKMLIKVLKEENKPFSYDEMTLALMIASGRSVSERKRTKATVQNTVFKLRNSSKVKTFSKGGRDKYIALSEWFDGENVKEEYANKVPDHVKKTPKKVSSGRGPGRPRKVVTEGAAPAKKAARKTTAKKKAAPRKASPKKASAAKKPTAAKKAPAVKKAPAAKKSTAAKRTPKAKAAKTTRSKKTSAAATAPVEATESAASSPAPVAKKAVAKRKLLLKRLPPALLKRSLLKKPLPPKKRQRQLKR